MDSLLVHFCLGFVHWCMHHNAREYGTRAFLVIWKKECLGFDWNFWRKKSLNDSNIICFLIFVQKIRKFRFPFLLSSDSFKWNILIFLHLLTEKNLKSHRILQFALLSRVCNRLRVWKTDAREIVVYVFQINRSTLPVNLPVPFLKCCWRFGPQLKKTFLHSQNHFLFRPRLKCCLAKSKIP